MPRTGTCEIRKSTCDRRNPTGVLLFVQQRVSPNSKSYSRSPGDLGKAFASLPFVRSGVVTRKSGGQTVRWSMATAKRRSVSRREAARSSRRRVWHTVSNRNSLVWRSQTSTSHVWHSTSTADPKSTTSLNEMCVGGRPSKRTGGTVQGCGVGQTAYLRRKSIKKTKPCCNE